MSESKKNGHGLTVLRGGVDGRGRRRSMIRTPEEIALDDRMRRRFMRVVTPSGAVPSRAIQEIKEGRQAPWRANARRVIEMRAAQVPTGEIKAAVVGEFAAWVDEVLGDTLKPAA